MQPDVIAWLDLETTDTDETLKHSAILEVGIVFTDFELRPYGNPRPYGDDAKFSLVVNPGLDQDKQSYITEYDVPAWLTPEETLEGIFQRMSPVVQDMHTVNGLWRDVQHSRLSTKDADVELCATLMKASPDRPIALAGSGVGHFDMRYLRRHMPRSFDRFAFAPYDVGSVRRFMRDLAGVDITPADPHQRSSGAAKAHRALDDAWAHWQEAIVYVSAFKELTL